MWPTLLTLWLALSGQAPLRPTPRRRPAFRRPTSRPRLESLEDRCLLSAPGTLDTTFGSGGVVTTSFGNKSYGTAQAVAVQSDGKIVEAGISTNTQGVRGKVTNSFDLVRYNPNGTLDSTFGNGGEVVTTFPANSIGGNTNNGTHLLVQPDGNILLEGIVNSN